MIRLVLRRVFGAEGVGVLVLVLICLGGAGAGATGTERLRDNAIVILGGSYQERVGLAGQLFHAGRAPLVVVADDGVRRGWSQRYQRNLYSVERIREALVRLGVPPGAIVALPYYKSGTVWDALAVRKYLLAHRITHAIIVTSDYHARRAAWILRRVLPPEITFSIAPARTLHDRFFLPATELLKSIYYYGRYGLFPLPHLPE
ncbi:YdcF family protein [Geomesophilobacter sediminis]|uniref:YdcF family protein n=1 Tax=Geomesophilobacter sediminis TaxID=2798584 RepID=A0A8J7M073_9BACT|nr:YdcF family protein [Geomesophilobacter sediminis]MBJ6723687.1 YdcF family protein [Geomesophilobacter sediminis]